ncbi:Syntaxin-binding protein 3 [Phlyctochytrium planicorne]|nr:Syntaxin-binding protein 3 [Phlyctochytrium planicorne]
MSSENLKDIVRKVILDRLKSHLRPKVNVILIEDTESNRLRLECNITDEDLLNLGVRETGILQSKRLARRGDGDFQYHAVYFLSPSAESINHVKGDFAKGRELYENAHFYFSSALEKPLLTQLFQLPKDTLQTCMELSLDFLPLESRVFHFNMPNTLSDLYKAQSETEVDGILSSIAKKFRGILYNLNEDPIIKYYDPTDSKKTISAILARKILQEVENIKKDEPSFPAPTPYDIHGPATLLIVDRAVDIVTPLIHSFGYQAMIYDCELTILDDVSGGKKTLMVELESSKPIVDETSEYFVKFRHETLFSAIEKTRALVQDAKAALNQKVSSVSQLKHKVLKRTEDEKKEEQLAALVALNSYLAGWLTERKMKTLSEFEQNLATGENELNENVNVTLKDLKAILVNEDIENFDKLRVLALYVILIGGVGPQDMDVFAKMMKVEPVELSVLKGLAYFGVNPEENKDIRNPSSPFMNQSRKQKGKSWGILNFFKQSNGKVDESSSQDEVYNVDRYQPALSYIIDDFLNGKSTFSTLEGSGKSRARMQSGYSSKVRKSAEDRKGQGVVMDIKTGSRPSWAKKRIPTEGGESESFRHNGPRLIIAVVGGVTHAEIRAIYLAAKKLKREIIIGSTSTLIPEEYIEDLHELGKLDSKPFVFQQYISSSNETRSTTPVMSSSNLDRSSDQVSRADSVGSVASQYKGSPPHSSRDSVSGSLFSSNMYPSQDYQTRPSQEYQTRPTPPAPVTVAQDDVLQRPASISSISSASSYNSYQGGAIPPNTASSAAGGYNRNSRPIPSVPKPPPDVMERAAAAQTRSSAAAAQSAPAPASGPPLPARAAAPSPYTSGAPAPLTPSRANPSPYASGAVSPPNAAPAGPRSPFNSAPQSNPAPQATSSGYQPNAASGYSQPRPAQHTPAPPPPSAYPQPSAAPGGYYNQQPSPPQQPSYNQSYRPGYGSTNASYASYNQTTQPAAAPQAQYSNQYSGYSQQPSQQGYPVQRPLVQLSTSTYNAAQQGYQQPQQPAYGQGQQGYQQQQQQQQPGYSNQQAGYYSSAQPQGQYSQYGQQPPTQPGYSNQQYGQQPQQSQYGYPAQGQQPGGYNARPPQSDQYRRY